MAVDSTSFNNPYANPYASLYGNYASTGLNDDFMTNAYICQNDATRVAQNPVFTGNYNLSGQPATDTFQRSSGALPATVLALTAGGATTAGLYHFGGDKVNPVLKDGVFEDGLLRRLEDESRISSKIKEAEQAAKNRIYARTKINGKPMSESQYNAIKKWAETGVKDTGVALGSITKKEQAEAIKKEVETKLGKINYDKLKAHVLKTETLDGSVKHLDLLNQRKAVLGDLKPEMSIEELTKRFKDNAKLFGINGKDDAEIEKIAKNFANKLDKVKAANEKAITSYEGIVKGIRERLTKNVTECGSWDSATQTLKKGAPESISKIFKNYKLSKAGKWGLAAAGVGAVIGWLFGKS